MRVGVFGQNQKIEFGSARQVKIRTTFSFWFIAEMKLGLHHVLCFQSGPFSDFPSGFH